MLSAFKRIKRTFDKKPIAAHLYVTEKCNLRCSYCTEFNNKVPHPALSDLKKWIDRLADLGCLRIGIQGGEPLLHPDIAAIVAHIRERGMDCSMSTNGLLLSRDIVKSLEEAGLQSIHVSIDRLTPNDDTKKCVALVKEKIRYLDGSSIDTHITGVLYGGSLAELPGVFSFAGSINASMKAHLIHASVNSDFTIDEGDKEPLKNFIDWEISEKGSGRNIRAPFSILKYQKGMLEGKNRDWTCLAGYKYIFVSAKGEFWLCSMQRHPGTNIMEITDEYLRKFNSKKTCQKGCGVYCVVAESLANSRTGWFIMNEVSGHVKGKIANLISRGQGK